MRRHLHRSKRNIPSIHTSNQSRSIIDVRDDFEKFEHGLGLSSPQVEKGNF